MADIMFGSARIRSLENAMIGRDRIARLLECRSEEEAYAALSEMGVTPVTDPETGKILREETLLSIQSSAYAEAVELCSDPDLIRVWQMPYDCNNIKAAIKCFKRGIDPSGMMFEFGTVPPAAVIRAVTESRFEELPPLLSDAAGEAVSEFSKTANPQTVDLILDGACYSAMLTLAKKSKNEYAARLVEAKIDLVNLMTVIRLLRMRCGEAGRLLLRGAVLPGGKLDASLLEEYYSTGESGMWEKLLYSDYARFASLVAESDRGLTAIERIADDCWMDFVREAKMIPFGDEVVIGYLLGTECALRNIRIILSGLAAGLAASTIRERIRESYV